jgi:transposase
VIFVGIDWAEAHHDAFVMDEAGEALDKARVPDGVEGVRRLHELIATYAEEPSEVIVGIEIDRGLLVGALVAAGYRVFAVNPMAASRYRDRHATSKAKSDRGDAKMLADLVRTDRHNHREVAGDSEVAEAVKVLARAHQTLIWTRQRQTNQLRNALREFYPAALAAFGTDLASADAVSVLEHAPTPELGRRASRSSLIAWLRRGGRKRGLDDRAVAIREALRSEQLEAPPVVSEAYGDTVVALVAVMANLNEQIATLETKLAARFDAHPDAEIVRSLPGLGSVLGARVLAEFGDDRTRFADAKGRRCYAGTAPITRASGTRLVVLSRIARNKRLADACYLWAFSALTKSPGARSHYDRRRAKGDTHHMALRSLANKFVGILHGCLSHRSLYSEAKAWPSVEEVAA